MAKLDIISGNNQNTSYKVQQKTTIGRLANNTIAIDDTKSSRQNSLVFIKDGLYYIRDLKSRNGTIVNGEKIENIQQLFAGDRIKVGNTIFIFSEEDDPDVTRDLASVKNELSPSPTKTPKTQESDLQKGIREASSSVKKRTRRRKSQKYTRPSINQKLESMNRTHVIIAIVVIMCVLFVVSRWLTLNFIS
ncbi:FHA domain-containing protein [Candidatus Uabimicrobium amorphum]|uniref:FHA domain-containing protein n=1 Tax=Uabimicrobium amorphum TaxID=2596890 RepID=A0A5S9F2P7_UABAM|nr:FHA domain-containing protein [Candidatus Uabimicrobium amorphum]BBM83702.1 FHA domain-containing protein [Candidatus Uabimicrobium amorphum]